MKLKIKLILTFTPNNMGDEPIERTQLIDDLLFPLLVLKCQYGAGNTGACIQVCTYSATFHKCQQYLEHINSIGYIS